MNDSARAPLICGSDDVENLNSYPIMPQTLPKYISIHAVKRFFEINKTNVQNASSTHWTVL